MEKIEITSATDPYFAAFWQLYEASFPLCERRSLNDQKRIFVQKSYALEAWVESHKLVGFIGWWDCNELRYVEHFAIDSAVRSLGYGTAFLSQWMSRSDTPVILEIEPVVDALTSRRRDFYLRLGYTENELYHWHPPYQKDLDMTHVELRILSYPQKIKETTYTRFLQIQRTEIIPL